MNKRIRKKHVRQLLLGELAIRFGNPDDAVVWLQTPNAEFDGRTPREAIAAGEVERVTLVLDAMNSAAHATTPR